MHARHFFVIFIALSVASCGDDGGNDPIDSGTDDGSSGGDSGVDGVVSCPRDPSVCGNGALEPGETCDDGNTADGDGCDASCQYVPTTAPDPACDLTGHWVAEKVTISEAIDLGIQGTTRNRFYYSIVQDGENVEIVDSLHCGYEVTSLSLTVTMNSQTRAALRCMGDSDGRKGTSTVLDGTSECQIAFDTLYIVHGLSPVDYWEDDDWAGASTGEGTPTKPAPESPNCDCNAIECICDDTGRYDPVEGTPGWADWDEDAHPGITLRPGGSQWYIHMREWDRFLGTIPQPASGAPQEFQLDVEWSNMQEVMGVVGGIMTDERPDTSADHYVTFKRIAAPDRTSMSDEEMCNMVVNQFQ